MIGELPPRTAYDLWAATYRGSGENPLTGTARAALESVVPTLAGRRVLDVACGLGRWALYAARRGARPSFGVDFSGAMLHAARRTEPGLSVAAADMCALPFASGSFDVVLHALALGHVRDLSAAVGEAGRVVAAGGFMAVVDVHPDAAARGWRRTFRDAAGGRHAVRWHAHAVRDVLAACSGAGLVVESHQALALDPATLPAHAPAEARGVTAVYALRARRA